MRSPLGTIGRGLAAGLVGGLLRTTVQALARLWLGVSLPAELVGDRVAPLLTIDQFFGLFGVFGGYNGLSYDGLRLGGPEITPITPIENFYTVTKNVVDPRVDAARWRFGVSGAVSADRSWTMDELLAMPQTTQETTLMCISNGVGDGLESNATWTGVPLADLLGPAGVAGDTVEVLLTAVDGYSDTFSIEKALDPTTLLAFRMNDPARLVARHVRGEEPEVDHERRGGHRGGEGLLRDAGLGPELRGAQPFALHVDRVRGHGAGGRRHGALRYRARRQPGSHDWRPAAAGPVQLAVRITDGTGQVQTAEERSTVPMGATGLHKIDVTVV